MQSKPIKSVMSLWPSKKQWKSWSLPSKITAIGTLIGIISLGLYLLDKSFNSPPSAVLNNIKESKIAVVDILEKADLHLGDNVYPDKYGFSYNPLNQDVYQQGVNGIVYYDKQTGNFLSDKGRPTTVGQALVDFIADKISKFDFSSWKWVKAFSPDDNSYETIINTLDDDYSIFMLGPTALVAKDSNWGNFYERYAAVGFARSVNLIAECERQGIDINDVKNLSVKIIIHCYHGGIRAGQNENFFIQFNLFSSVIPSKTRRMRDAQEIVINIPNEEVKFNRENLLYIYVLPWIEEKPQLERNGRILKPVHFRDVGITHIEIKIEERS